MLHLFLPKIAVSNPGLIYVEVAPAYTGAKLTRRCRFKTVVTFIMDEYVGLPQSHRSPPILPYFHVPQVLFAQRACPVITIYASSAGISLPN